MAAFADRLTAVRERAGLSQYALAKRSGVSKQALSLLELGEREPNWETVQRLALALGVDCREFVDPALTLPPEGPPARMGRPPKAEPEAPLPPVEAKPSGKKPPPPAVPSTPPVADLEAQGEATDGKRTKGRKRKN